MTEKSSRHAAQARDDSSGRAAEVSGESRRRTAELDELLRSPLAPQDDVRSSAEASGESRHALEVSGESPRRSARPRDVAESHPSPKGGLRTRKPEVTAGEGAGKRKRDLTRPPSPEPLPVPVFDNHTHLEFEDGIDVLDPLESLALAESAGVQGVVQVGTDLETSRWSAELAAADPRVLAAVALHPNEAPRLADEGTLGEHLSEIARLAAKPRVRAIGETGLDFFRTGEDGREAQYESFEAHIDIAKANDLAMQIHDRDAHDEVVATLLRVGAPERTVFHCFSGDSSLARLCAEHGWYLSFAGTVTFKNAPALREALAVADPTRILVETDAPFLTPEPLRGRPNAPYLMPHTVRRMAEVRGEPLDEFCTRLAANTERVYGSWAMDDEVLSE